LRCAISPTTADILWSAMLSTNLLPALYLHMRRKQIAKEGRA